MLAVACCACAAERLHSLLCLQVRTTCAFSTFSLTGSSRSPTCQLLRLRHKAFGAMFFLSVCRTRLHSSGIQCCEWALVQPCYKKARSRHAPLLAHRTPQHHRRLPILSASSSSCSSDPAGPTRLKPTGSPSTLAAGTDTCNKFAERHLFAYTTVGCCTKNATAYVSKHCCNPAFVGRFDPPGVVHTALQGWSS